MLARPSLSPSFAAPAGRRRPPWWHSHIRVVRACSAPGRACVRPRDCSTLLLVLINTTGSATTSSLTQQPLTQTVLRRASLRRASLRARAQRPAPRRFRALFVFCTPPA